MGFYNSQMQREKTKELEKILNDIMDDEKIYLDSDMNFFNGEIKLTIKDKEYKIKNILDFPLFEKPKITETFMKFEDFIIKLKECITGNFFILEADDCNRFCLGFLCFKRTGCEYYTCGISNIKDNLDEFKKIIKEIGFWGSIG
jgi:hypothetical protein